MQENEVGGRLFSVATFSSSVDVSNDDSSYQRVWAFFNAMNDAVIPSTSGSVLVSDEDKISFT